MKITLDFKQKEVQVDNIPLGELLDCIQKMFPNDWQQWKIVSKAVEVPRYYGYTPYYRDYRPWWSTGGTYYSTGLTLTSGNVETDGNITLGSGILTNCSTEYKMNNSQYTCGVDSISEDKIDIFDNENKINSYFTTTGEFNN